jgi:predicted nucleic acid-binding protein
VTVGYVESSALVKLAVPEPESAAFRDVFRELDSMTSSELTVAEVSRATRRAGDPVVARGRAALLRIELVPVDRAILDRAAALDPPTLRSLDAIHVATALELETADLVFFAYDRRTLDAAEANGLTVSSPGV